MTNNMIARYIALPLVSAGILGGAALGLAGMANAATPTGPVGPGYSYSAPVKAHAAPNAERQGPPGPRGQAGLAQPPRRLAHQRPEPQLISPQQRPSPKREGLFACGHTRRPRHRRCRYRAQ